MASQHAGGSGEFIHVGGAGGGVVETLLEAVAFVLDSGKGEVDFGQDAGYVEAFDVCGSGVVSGVGGFFCLWG